jgi:P27 family predicted phage terminase small subunit
MQRGPKPKPTARKKLEGNPGQRPLNAHEPEIAATASVFETPPRELVGDAVAVAEWHRLAPILRGARVLTDADWAALVALCQQWARYLGATSKIAAGGMVVRSPSGYPMPNPYIGIANKALGNCLKLWAELGLTPSSRVRVQTLPYSTTGGGVDAFAEFEDVH